MNQDSRMYVFEQLRGKFVDFMSALKQMPGSPMQKQQAFIRFDEGHMWMQNAVLSFTAPPQAPTELPKTDDSKQLENETSPPLEPVPPEAPSVQE